MTHVFNNGVSARDFNVFFAVADRACGADVLVGIAPRANDRRVADTTGDFPCETTGGRTAGDFAFLAQRGTMRGAGWGMNDAADRFHTIFRWDADSSSDLIHAAKAELPFVSVGRRSKTLAPFETGNAGTPPVGMSFFP